MVKKVAILVSVLFSVMLGLLSYAGTADSAEEMRAPDTRTLALWHFDEGKGTPTDSLTKDHEATIIGEVTWTGEGKFGPAMRFSGKDSYIKTSGPILASNNAHDLTLEAWVRTEKGGTVIAGISGGSTWLALGVWWKGSGNEGKAFFLTSLERNTNITGTTIVTDGNWHHIAAVFEKGVGKSLYVDGKLEASDSVSAIGGNSNGWRIGKFSDMNPNLFKGVIDEVRISSCARYREATVFTPNVYVVRKPSRDIFLDGDGQDFGYISPQHIWYPPQYVTLNKKKHIVIGKHLWAGKEDLSARAALLVDSEAFYLLAEVVDDNPLEQFPGTDFRKNDCVELFLSLKPHDKQSDDMKYRTADYQILFCPGNDKDRLPAIRIRSKVKGKFHVQTVEKPELFVRQRTLQLNGKPVSGYVLEAKIPLRYLSFKPLIGKRVTFNLVVNDRDGQKFKQASLSGLAGYAGSAGGWESAYIYKCTDSKQAIVPSFGEVKTFGAAASNLLIPAAHIPEGWNDKEIHIWDMNLAAKGTFGREGLCLNGIWGWKRFSCSEKIPEDFSFAKWNYTVLPVIPFYRFAHANFVVEGENLKLDLAGSIPGRYGKEFYVYERQFKVPATWKGSTILLTMGKKVDFYGHKRDFYYRVYLNEKPVSLWKHCSDMKVYLADHMRWSDTNRLTILKVNLPEAGQSADSFGDIWLYRKPIWMGQDTPSVERCVIRTSVKSKTIEVDVHLAPRLSVDEPLFLSARIFDWKSGEDAITIPPVRLRMIKKVDSIYTLTASWKNPKLWSPASPHLYNIQFVLKDAQGRVIDDSFVERFGFREVEIKGKDLLLNGYPMHLIIWCPWQQESYQTFAYYKNLGFNTLYKFSTMNKGFAAWADELGMMVIAVPGGCRHSVRGDFKHPSRIHDIQAKINHPSIISWIARVSSGAVKADVYGYWTWNFHKVGIDYYPYESPQAIATKKKTLDTIEFLKKEDPTRPVHIYCGGSLGPIESTMSHSDFGMPLQESGGLSETWARQKIAKPYISFESWVYPGSGLNISMSHGKWQTRKEREANAFTSGEESEWILLTEQTAQYFGEKAYALTCPLRTYPSEFKGGWDLPDSALLTPHWYLISHRGRLGVKNVYSELGNAMRSLGVWEHARADRGYGITGFWYHMSNINRFLVVPRAGAVRAGMNRDFTWWYKPNAYALKKPHLRYDTMTREAKYWHAWDAECMPEEMPNLDELKSIPRNPYQEVFDKANAPLMVFIGGGPGEWDFRHKDHAFFAGERIRKQVVVVNDLEDDVTFDVKWQLKKKGGTRVIQSGVVPVSVKRGSVGKFPFSFKALRVSTDSRYQLSTRAECSVTGRLYDDVLDIEIFAGTKAPIVKAKVALYDEKGLTTALLKKAKIRFNPIEDFSDLAGCDILIIGRESLSRKIDGNAITKAITDGLKLLVFEQGRESLIGPWLKDINLRHQFIITRDHPVLLGLTDDDFANWRGSSDMTEPYPQMEPAMEYSKYWMIEWPKWGNEGIVCTFPLRRPQYGNYRVLLCGGFDHEYTGLVEFMQGKGTAVFCQLDVTGRYGTDPIATKLVQRLFEYLGAAARKETLSSLSYTGRSKEESLLRQLGARIEKNVHAAGLLVLGQNASEVKRKEWIDLVATDGKNLLLLWPDVEADLSWLPFHVKIEKRKDVFKTMLDSRDKQSSLLYGITSVDFYWRFKREVNLITECPKNGVLLAGGLLAAIPHGRGNIFLFQVNPEDHRKERSFKKSIRLLSALLTNLGVDLGTSLRLTTSTLDLSQELWKFKTDPGNVGLGAGWAKPEHDDSKWKDLLVGKSWELQGINEENPMTINHPHTSYNGVAWYRIKVKIPEVYRNRELCLVMGGIRGHDKAYFNGVEIGYTDTKSVGYDNYWCCFRDYRIPANLVREGDNQIAVWVDNRQGPGGINEWPVRIMAVDEPTETALTPMQKDNYLYDPYRFVQW